MGPKLSVLMPVFNAAPFVRTAVQSILSQTFSDFELLIIDDGSTDGGTDAIREIQDTRIRLIKNERNLGIVAALNKGIDLAAGEYIARMDADDVSLPERFQKQVAMLDANPQLAAVAARIALIGRDGEPTGSWRADCETLSYEAIRRTLPRGNCIAHPSVMIRSRVAKEYRYSNKQRNTEDYDLWLRLIADNCRIEKLDDVLLHYRVYRESVSGESNTDLFKETRAKARFLIDAVCEKKARTSFHLAVLKHVALDLIRNARDITVDRVLAIGRATFIAIGKPMGRIFSCIERQGPRLVFFFPLGLEETGGSERVHAEIVAASLHKKPWIVLGNDWSRKSRRHRRSGEHRMSDISFFLRNSFTKNLALGFFAGYINYAKPVVFGGNSEFFYWLLPHLDPGVFCIDIVHAYDDIMNVVSLPHVSRLDRRVVLSDELRKTLASLYRRDGIPEICEKRTEFIQFGVEMPTVLTERGKDRQVEILYVGRGTAVKRVHLVGRIARLLAEREIDARVSLVGDLFDWVGEADRRFCNFLGEIHDRVFLEECYRRSDLLVITSSSEGVSLVKMEAMAFGVVPVATAVGGIPADICHGENGFLVSPDQNEDELVETFTMIIQDIVTDRDRLHQMSLNAHVYASVHFDRFRALQRFKELLEVAR